MGPFTTSKGVQIQRATKQPPIYYFLRHQSIPKKFFILNKDFDSKDSRFQVPQNQRYRTQSGAGRPYAYIKVRLKVSLQLYLRLSYL